MSSVAHPNAGGAKLPPASGAGAQQMGPGAGDGAQFSDGYSQQFAPAGAGAGPSGEGAFVGAGAGAGYSPSPMASPGSMSSGQLHPGNGAGGNRGPDGQPQRRASWMKIKSRVRGVFGISRTASGRNVGPDEDGAPPGGASGPIQPQYPMHTQDGPPAGGNSLADEARADAANASAAAEAALAAHMAAMTAVSAAQSVPTVSGVDATPQAPMAGPMGGQQAPTSMPFSGPMGHRSGPMGNGAAMGGSNFAAGGPPPTQAFQGGMPPQMQPGQGYGSPYGPGAAFGSPHGSMQQPMGPGMMGFSPQQRQQMRPPFGASPMATSSPYGSPAGGAPPQPYTSSPAGQAPQAQALVHLQQAQEEVYSPDQRVDRILKALERQQAAGGDDVPLPVMVTLRWDKSGGADTTGRSVVEAQLPIVVPLTSGAGSAALWPVDVKNALHISGTLLDRWLQPVAIRKNHDRSPPQQFQYESGYAPPEQLLFQPSSQHGGFPVVDARFLEPGAVYDVRESDACLAQKCMCAHTHTHTLTISLSLSVYTLQVTFEDHRREALRHMSDADVQEVTDRFNQFDRDGNGTISRDEALAAVSDKVSAWTVRVSPRTTGDGRCARRNADGV